MCDIYRNSVLTIAASCSASDCTGFLGERTIKDPIRLDKPPRLQSLCFRQTIDHSRMLRTDPIHTRAWTFQETILPRRLLSFGSYEASWECETHRQCECGQLKYLEEGRTTSNELGRAAYRKYTRGVIEGKFHAGNSYGLPGLGTLPSIREIYTTHVLAEAPEPQDQKAYREYVEKVRRMTLGDVIRTAEFASADARALIFSESHYIESGELSPQDARACAELLENTSQNRLALDAFYRYWRRVLVPEYTSRKLSKDSDRLVALQAIASDIHSGIRDQYLAGLWEGDLINQLCWQSVDRLCLPADNQSPSWSWSSISGPVMPCLLEELESSRTEPSSSLLEDTVIKSAQCSLAGQNSCGRILDGTILLEASAMEVKCIRRKDTGEYEFRAHGTRRGHPPCALSAPLTLSFYPDTPLGCRPDGSLVRFTKDNCLDIGPHSQPMEAILLFVKVVRGLGCCVLVCSRVLAETNTCSRLGIVFIPWSDVEKVPELRYTAAKQFVLV